MAWDTEGTRRALLEGGVVEFSAAGFAGARVDRIAAAAGVNKERIYSYFGDKAGLFDAVALHVLSRVTAEVPFLGTGPEAIADFAGRLFDHLQEKPELARLMAWEGLERGTDVVALDDRIAHCGERVAGIMGALPGVSRADAAELLFSLIAASHAWHVFPQLAHMFVGSGDDADAGRRATVVAYARALATEVASRAN